MKKIICSVLALMCSAMIFAMDMPFFSGYAGILGDISGKSTAEKPFMPDLTSEAFFSGQLDFKGTLLLRGEFFLRTRNLMENTIFIEPQSPNAFFRIQELSATMKHKTTGATNYFSIYLGNFEPIGSDIFLRRQFGIQPITSSLTESWHGIGGASIYPFYGAGLSYTLHRESPIALTFNLYADVDSKSDSKAKETVNVINTDLRFSCVYPNFTFDICGGIGLPLQQNTETGQSVVLLVRTVNFHGGLNMLVGNRYTSSVFLQAGLADVSFNPGTKTSINFSDLYYIIEPRFNLRTFRLDFSLFNIPARSLQDMIYLQDFNAASNITGIDINVVTDRLFIGNTNFTFGIHSIFTLNDPNYASYMAQLVATKGNPLGIYAAIKDWGKDFFVTPYISVPVLGGTFNASLRTSIFGFMKDPAAAVKLTAGFRTQL